MNSVLDHSAIGPSLRDFIARSHGILIDGQWRDAAGGQRLDVFEPSSAERIASIAAIAVLETIDNGKPLSAAREIDLPDALRFARYMAGWATKIDGRP